MDIKQGNKQFYIVDDQNNTVGNITWADSDNKDVIIANHTFVDPSLRGKNVARKLLDKLVDYARDNKLKIYPTCSYVVRAFEKYDVYDDIKV